jgi:hypothetical protein
MKQPAILMPPAKLFGVNRKARKPALTGKEQLQKRLQKKRNKPDNGFASMIPVPMQPVVVISVTYDNYLILC